MHHEIFTSYVEAGFTRAEALDILREIVAAIIKNGASQ